MSNEMNDVEIEALSDDDLDEVAGGMADDSCSDCCSCCDCSNGLSDGISAQ